jgi:phosphatidylinositol-3-phosphatase
MLRNSTGILTIALGLASTAQATDSAAVASVLPVPRLDHVVIAIMENTSDSSIIGNTTDAPYINTLANSGAQFSDSHAITHPSEPNYLALFSGSTQGITDDSCPHTFNGANLGSQLITAGFVFTGYSESMPADGFAGCASGNYARKHNPWVNFSNIPVGSNLTFSAFPADFATLPTLSFVVPNLCDDMHDCSIATGDAWLQQNLDAYAQWAKSHNSLLILTWDEDDSSTSANQIPTIFNGAHVKIGTYSTTINHFDVLATLEDMYGLANLGGGTAITAVWDDVIFADGFDH